MLGDGNLMFPYISCRDSSQSDDENGAQNEASRMSEGSTLQGHNSPTRFYYFERQCSGMRVTKIM